MAVTVDGGRLQTRVPTLAEGPGLPAHGWKEDKVACLHVLKGPCFSEDPHPGPPRKFLDAPAVDQRVKAFPAQRGSGPHGPEAPSATDPLALPARAGAGDTAPTPDEAASANDAVSVQDAKAAVPWPPQRDQRTCVATMQDSAAFGKLVAAEAYARNFFAAARRAFLGDGQAHNGTIHKKWFQDFEPIADFSHPLSYLYAAATAVSADPSARWSLYVAWMTGCWQGQVNRGIEALRQQAARLGPGPPAEALPDTDPRAIVRRALTYLENNGGHMDYPRYRQTGLPVTRAAVESLIKEVNYRVKGTAKFGNQPEEAEAILQVRAALLSSDDRLRQHLQSRPGCPYRYATRRKSGETPKAA